MAVRSPHDQKVVGSNLAGSSWDRDSKNDMFDIILLISGTLLWSKKEPSHYKWTHFNLKKIVIQFLIQFMLISFAHWYNNGFQFQRTWV